MTQMTAPVSHGHSGRMMDTHGAVLPLESARLDVDTRGGLARVRLVQRFANHHAEPLSVTYKLPLPADAAVGGFTFRVGERVIKGIVEGRKKARDRYERAIYEGKSAALLEQDRSSLFTQEIGNIPPGQAVEAEIEIDQPLAWLLEGCWEWRFPLAAAPRYLGSEPIEGDVSIAVASGDIGARASLTMTIRDAIAQGRSPESPSHPLVCSRNVQVFNVELGSGNKIALDRDVVVRWPAAALAPGATLDVARPATGADGAAYGLLTIVPPTPEANVDNVARDLTLLIDTSGSMSGEPLEQAKRVACALVDALAPTDQLEMIEFSNTASSFRSQPEAATPALKKKAIQWINGLTASGGTEMLSGVQHAMKELRAGSQRQIILVTDGLVGFEREIVKTLLSKLPSTARLHALGVGSAVNRSLLAPIARAGRGIEAIVGLGEDPERAAARILARTNAPVVVDLVVEGRGVTSVVPSRPSDVYLGAPLRLAVQLAPEGGEVTVRGRMAAGAFVRHVRFDRCAPGEGSTSITKLFARELVEDLEMKISAGEDPRAQDAEIERVGTTFGISTRLTSWVAVSDEATVDPRDPTRHEVQPQALPYGMSAEGLGLRACAPPPAGAAFPLAQAAPMMPGMAPGMGGFAPPMKAMSIGGAAPRDSLGFGRAAPTPPAQAPIPSNRPYSSMPASPARPASEPEGSYDLDEEASDDRTRSALPTGAPPPQPGPARRESLYEAAKSRMKEMFTPKPKAAEPMQAEKADKKAEVKARKGAPAINGRIARVDADTVYIEIVAPPSGMTLDLEGATATVVLADGSSIDVEIVTDKSTRSGEHRAGVTLRIVLRAAATLGASVSLARITFASGTILEAR